LIKKILYEKEKKKVVQARKRRGGKTIYSLSDVKGSIRILPGRGKKKATGVNSDVRKYRSSLKKNGDVCA